MGVPVNCDLPDSDGDCVSEGAEDVVEDADAAIAAILFFPSKHNNIQV